jgi:hypothetical protein
MDEDSESCADCGFLFEKAGSRERKPCPQCVSKKRSINVSLCAEVKLFDSLRGQAKNPQYTGTKKLRWDSFTGWVKSQSLGKMVKKMRLIDKDNNVYKETVTDPDTKEIIHKCEEPLNTHVGRGSAKSKKT